MVFVDCRSSALFDACCVHLLSFVATTVPAFLMTGHVVSLGIVGTSGPEFVAVQQFARYLSSQRDKLWDKYRVKIVVGGVCDEHRMVLSDRGIDMDEAPLSELLQGPQSRAFDADAFSFHIRAVS